jgi:hypothetical protein
VSTGWPWSCSVTWAPTRWRWMCSPPTSGPSSTTRYSSSGTLHIPQSTYTVVFTTEDIFLLEMKQGYCICPLSWSVHCNFTGEGKCKERGWACTPTFTSLGYFYPHDWMYARKQPLLLCALCGLYILICVHKHVSKFFSVRKIVPSRDGVADLYLDFRSRFGSEWRSESSTLPWTTDSLEKKWINLIVSEN